MTSRGGDDDPKRGSVEKLRGVTKGCSEDGEAIALAGRLNRACLQDVGPAGAVPLDTMGLYASSLSSEP